MEEHRAHRRFCTNGTAKDLWGSETGRYAVSVKDFSRAGIGIGIPHDYNPSNSKEVELRVKLLPSISPVRITGTVQWTRELKGEGDFAMTGGVKCKEIHPIELWRLITYCYENSQHENFNK